MKGKIKLKTVSPNIKEVLFALHLIATFDPFSYFKLTFVFIFACKSLIVRIALNDL